MNLLSFKEYGVLSRDTWFNPFGVAATSASSSPGIASRADLFDPSGWCCGIPSGSASGSEWISLSISTVDTECDPDSDSDRELLCHTLLSSV